VSKKSAVSKKKQQQASGDLDPLAQMLSALWATLRAGDVLQAEVETARCFTIFRQLGIDEEKSDSIFIGMAKQGGNPEDAALLRLIMLLGAPAVRGQARTALGELTAKGVYPASWVAEAGKAEPVAASRVYSVYGDWEDIHVRFRYESGEHTLVARVDLANLPQVRHLTLAEGEVALDRDLPFAGIEEISFADARTHLDPALLAAELSEFTDAETRALMPIAKSRMRRLPADDSRPEARYSSDDRAALVREFLASPHAAEAVAADEDSTRFWAEILTAWSSRVLWYPPLQMGPRTLKYLLSEYAPYTYSVTAEQREHMEQAVAAWARWSAAQRGLDEDHMVSLLPVTLSDSAFLYQEEEAAERRAYLADVATSDADVTSLEQTWATRTTAIPVSQERDGDDAERLDPTNPDDRATYLAADFAGCAVPVGLSRDEFVGVLRQVADELWDPELSGTRKHALALLAQGELNRHDIMHALVRQALSQRG
jgi:hypothetical protein